MKIYFGFTVAGDRSAVMAARRIVEILVEMKHEVLTRHLVEDNAWEADRRITAKEVYLRDMKWLEQCDLFMAEVSGSSFGLGFETGYLLGTTAKKVVLFLSPGRRKQNISSDHGYHAPELQSSTIFHPRRTRDVDEE
jgi:nucleoside 2-deoxyribosyltransferase